MGFKDVFKKIGKVALQAAPYVAAPFTGGASLSLAPATRQLGQKWAEHDARKNYEKGLGPSKFDKILGIGSSAAGMASDFGAFDKMGGKVGDKASTGWQGKLKNVFEGGSRGQGIVEGDKPWEPNGGRSGGWQELLGRILESTGRGGDQGEEDPYRYRTPPFAGESNSSTRMDRGSSDRGLDRFHRQMRRQLGPVMGQEDQSNPNLADSIGAGRMEALRNQPWRGGYDVPGNLDEEGKSTTRRMPPVYPTGQRKRRRPIGGQLDMMPEEAAY